MSTNKTEPVSCVACGYDGGLAHERERVKWMETLHEAKLKAVVGESVHISRAWAKALGAVLCTLIVGFVTYFTATAMKPGPPAPAPAPPPTSISVVADRLAVIYSACVAHERVEVCNAVIEPNLEALRSMLKDHP